MADSPAASAIFTPHADDNDASSRIEDDDDISSLNDDDQFTQRPNKKVKCNVQNCNQSFDSKDKRDVHNRNVHQKSIKYKESKIINILISPS